MGAFAGLALVGTCAFALLLLLGLWALWALVGAGFWGALAGLGWRSFWGARGCSVCGQGCGGGLVALGLVGGVAGAALFVGLWVLVGTRGLSLGLLPCGRMWALACGRKCCGRLLGGRVSACGRLWADVMSACGRL